VYAYIDCSGISYAAQKDNQNGFATAISAWLLLANKGSSIGGTITDGEDPKPTSTSSSGSIPTLAVAPVSDQDMWAMFNDGGEKKGYAIVLGSMP